MSGYRGATGSCEEFLTRELAEISREYGRAFDAAVRDFSGGKTDTNRFSDREMGAYHFVMEGLRLIAFMRPHHVGNHEV